jgi:uncharacterized protein YprB with RNaseH-like and TPR domain
VSFLDKLRRAYSRNGVGDGSAASGATPAAGGYGFASGVRQLLRQRALRQLARRELPAGDVLANDRGECFRRRSVYPLDHRHGARALGDALGAAAGDLDPRAALFLDTETTGLAGGAGTVVFLCGCAWFDGDALVLEQLFLRAFADEPALLLRVAELLRERPALVTYVGKSFDRHRLAARMAVQKIASDVLGPRHLDLYHVVRGARRRRELACDLPDCKLRTVERALLGVERSDDLPGSEAPAAFLGWLRDGTGAVDRVFEHNRLDVLSVVGLLGWWADRDGGPAHSSARAGRTPNVK